MAVEGLPELLKSFRKLPKEFQGNNAKNPIIKGLMSGALPIVRTAQELNPDETLSTEKAIRRRRVSKPVEMFEVEVFVDRNSKKGEKRPWYWFLTEFGTSTQSARPFMRPAFEIKKFEALSIFTKRMAKALDVAAKKVRR